MKNITLVLIAMGLSLLLGVYLKPFILNTNDIKFEINKTENKIKTKENMKLGAFSMSLSVKDIKVSKAFYENLGFTVLGGGIEKNYLIMKNENSLIGLFQGMFKGNILTFNPGWDETGSNIEKFDDIREIQKTLKGHGIKLTSEADETTTGPASLTTTDPDGNVILIDQHR